jgi:hypothetical protein
MFGVFSTPIICVKICVKPYQTLSMLRKPLITLPCLSHLGQQDVLLFFVFAQPPLQNRQSRSFVAGPTGRRPVRDRDGSMCLRGSREPQAGAAAIMHLR